MPKFVVQKTNTRKPAIFLAMALIAVTLFTIFTNRAEAGELAGQQVTAGANYNFLDCRRPAQPITPVFDHDSYLRASAEHNAYAADVRDYLACIRKEAERDIETQTALIKAAYENEAAFMKLSAGESRQHLQGWEQNF